jgi:MFS family permease
LNKRLENKAGEKTRIFYGWYIVAAFWVMLFLLSAVGISIFFKPILDEFGWDRATLSLIQTSALLLSAVIAPFLGKLIDRFGPRVMLFICLGTQTLSSTMYGLATGAWQVFTGRFLYETKGLQSGQVLINRWFVKKRGQAQGIAATGMPAGALVLSPLSQFLILAWGWRQTMFFWAGITFIVLLPLTLLIRDHPKDKNTVPDGESVTVVKPDKGSKDVIPVEEYTSSSGKRLAEAARTSSFWLISAAQLICGISCGFMMTHIVIFATDYGYSEMIGASLLSVQGGLNLLGVVLTGHMSDRYARNRVLALTHFIRSLSFVVGVIFILLGGGSLWLLYAAMGLFGFGWFTTSPLTSGLIADLFGGRSMGTIIGITIAAHTIGMALGSYGGGITYDITGSYFGFFIVQAVLESLAAVLVIIIRRPVPAIREKISS